MSPVRRKGQEGQHLIQLRLEFPDHLRCGPPPARSEAPRPYACLDFALRIPDPPELPAKFPPLEPTKPQSQPSQVAKPIRHAQLVPRRRLDRLRPAADA